MSVVLVLVSACSLFSFVVPVSPFWLVWQFPPSYWGGSALLHLFQPRSHPVPGGCGVPDLVLLFSFLFCSFLVADLVPDLLESLLPLLTCVPVPYVPGSSLLVLFLVSPAGSSPFFFPGEPCHSSKVSSSTGGTAPLFLSSNLHVPVLLGIPHLDPLVLATCSSCSLTSVLP